MTRLLPPQFTTKIRQGYPFPKHVPIVAIQKCGDAFVLYSNYNPTGSLYDFSEYMTTYGLDEDADIMDVMTQRQHGDIHVYSHNGYREFTVTRADEPVPGKYRKVLDTFFNDGVITDFDALISDHFMPYEQVVSNVLANIHLLDEGVISMARGKPGMWFTHVALEAKSEVDPDMISRLVEYSKQTGRAPTTFDPRNIFVNMNQCITPLVRGIVKTWKHMERMGNGRRLEIGSVKSGTFRVVRVTGYRKSRYSYSRCVVFEDSHGVRYASFRKFPSDLSVGDTLEMTIEVTRFDTKRGHNRIRVLKQA